MTSEAALVSRTASAVVSDVVVTARRDEADGVVGFTLARPSGAVLPAWTPGAHVDLLLPAGPVRQYSLCGDPADAGQWRIGVLREVDGRGGSRWIAEELTEGMSLQVRGPRNHFPLQPAGRYVFFAGGIGITPLLPMIRSAQVAGADWVLHYGGRTRASMAFLDELAGYGDRVRLHPQDEVGLLDLDAVLDPPDAHVYCCGPAGLIDAVERRWAPDLLHVERFTAAPAIDGAATNNPATDGPAADGAAFDVVCERSGRTVTVSPDMTVLDAVRDTGIEVLSSCEEGICGTCETTVLDGEPEHRDSLLTDEEKAAGDTMLICVSRCRGARLVLDL